MWRGWSGKYGGGLLSPETDLTKIWTGVSEGEEDAELTEDAEEDLERMVEEFKRGRLVVLGVTLEMLGTQHKATLVALEVCVVGLGSVTGKW